MYETEAKGTDRISTAKTRDWGENPTDACRA
jgi:hypothetical protein